MNELVKKSNNVEEVRMRECDILNVEYTFSEKIETAVAVANVLSKVIDDNNLYIKIGKKQKKKYVLVEGWNTLGTMLGIHTDTEWVKPYTSLKGELGYQAKVRLVAGNGAVLATAEAIDVPQTDSWGNLIRDEAAMYSMCQTRATGKVYRTALSWIMKLAGYEATPAEEMENINCSNDYNVGDDKKSKKPKSSVKSKSPDVIDADVVEPKDEVVVERVVDIGDPKFETYIKSVCTEIYDKVHVAPSKAKVVHYVRNSDEFDDKLKKELVYYIRENWQVYKTWGVNK